MCLIIQREPNFNIPFDKFEAACINNPDGYGLSFPDDKGLTVLRTSDTPDIDKLYRLVNEELIDKRLMLHLRYTTAGDTIVRNSHPFPVLEKDKDGIDLRMAHNGTLHKYKGGLKDWESDTRKFVRTYVRPLFKRMSKAMPPEELMTDTFIKELLEGQLTASSVLTFLDSDGRSLVCNPTGNGGKQEDGWYYSNTYSFNKKHREPAKPVGFIGHYPDGYRSWSPPSKVSSTQIQRDCNIMKFTKKHNCELEELYLLTDPTIEALVDEHKDDTKLLIKELLFECQRLEKTNKRYLKQLNRSGKS